MIIEEFRNIKIAYLRRTGAYGLENQKLMVNFKRYLKENQLFNNTTVILGIPLDNLANTPSEKIRYDVGIVIQGSEVHSLDTRKLDNGKYAIFEIPHTEQDVISFWNNLPNLTAGLPVDETKPVIERYSAMKIASHLCEFCIPLKSL